MSVGARCEHCMFYTRQNNESGLCRYNPPTVLAMPVANPEKDRLAKPFTTWPVVRVHDWCGGFERSTDAKHGTGRETSTR